jgi:hypothetical protein
MKVWELDDDEALQIAAALIRAVDYNADIQVGWDNGLKIKINGGGWSAPFGHRTDLHLAEEKSA